MRYIIVGGTSGIGLATAGLAVAAGHSVLALGRDPGKFAAAQRQGAATAQLDACDAEAVARFFAAQPRFDHLVLCVSGGGAAGNFRTAELPHWQTGFQRKFWAQVQCAQAALGALSAQGSITFVTAISSRAAVPGTAGLAAINAALEALVPILASELRPVRVNALAPGVVDTPWWNQVTPEVRGTLFARQASQVPAGRVGLPEELADAIMFLTRNAFITGAVLDCDGGWKLKPA